MQVQFGCIYKLDTISSLPDGKPLSILDLDDPKCKASITNDISKHDVHIYTWQALAGGLMGGLVGQASGGEEAYQNRRRDLIEEGRKKSGKGAFLLFEGGLDIPETNLRFVRSFSDVAFGLDVFDKQIVTAKLEPIVRSVLTATLATLADAHEPRASLVGRYIIGEYGPLTLHNVQITALAPEVYVSPTMSAEIAAQLPTFVEVMLKEPFLEKVGRLFAASLAERDHLRRYLTGWTALEAFVGGSFKHRYSAYWNKLKMDGLHTEARPLFPDWVKVEEGKYSLADKFAIIAWILNGKNAQADLELFRASKKDRDDIAHGDEVNEASLPVNDVRNLLQRYLNLHARAVLSPTDH